VIVGAKEASNGQ